MNLKKSSFAIIMVIVFVIGAGAGVFIGRGTLDINTGDSNLSVSSDKYQKAAEIQKLIEENYYKDIDTDDITEGMYRGMFEALGDQYSYYMTKEEYDTYEASMTGEFEGVGITFNENEKGQYVVYKTEKGSPASKEDIKKGDIMTKVDGKEYDTSDAFGAALRGTAGTKVTLTYMRGDEEKEVTMTREKIVMQTIETKTLNDNIGYIKISAFESQTDEDFEEALEKFEKKKVKGLVIDIRDNGGGLVDSATTIADQLLGKGTITYMEDRNGEKEYYKSDAEKTDLPYVVLVNGNSASASEILAAAVKDNGPGKVVGVKTYGKGVVQISNELSDGSGFSMTIMQYFSPKGTTINEKGVTPQYKVKGSDAQLEKAEELLE